MSKGVSVYHIEPEFIHRVWADAAEFLRECEQYGDEYTIDQLKVDVVAGRTHLLVMADPEKVVGALLIDFINYPNKRVGFIKAYGGVLTTTEQVWADVADWMRKRGATATQCAVRDSVARLIQKIGFEPRYTIMEQEL